MVEERLWVFFMGVDPAEATQGPVNDQMHTLASTNDSVDLKHEIIRVK